MKSSSSSVTTAGATPTSGIYAAATITELKFEVFWHPHVCAFIEALNRDGVPGLLTLEDQQLTHEAAFFSMFNFRYGPTSDVAFPYPLENVDFRIEGSYSLYNWELFLHIPLLIATRLSKNQQFEEAQKWFHYIFNPTDISDRPAPQRYWKVLPFYRCAETQRIEDMLRQLSKAGGSWQPSDCQQDVQTQLIQWEHNPFSPHAIGRMRLIAYQKCVVMKYIDNLIAWADLLFSQDTMESINEATQLYVLAAQILGRRPERVPSRGTMQEYTYHDLLKLGLDKDDSLSDPLVAQENEFPFSNSSNGASTGVSAGLDFGSALYFCIPQNDQLLAYWDTVADRLFKIRNCMNIEGMERQLPLFAPPIDPALLVKAAAMGVDLSSALNDINAATPRYRFTFMLQKALELCADVKALGSALLTVLEKKDAEALTLLRAGQETDLLNAVKQVKEQQIQEAQDTLAGLNAYRNIVEARRLFYQNIVKISDGEQAYMDGLGTAHWWNQAAQFISSAASIAHGTPQINKGTTPGGMAGTPGATITVIFGGSNVGSALQAAATVNSFIAAEYSHDATMASIRAGYDRRWDDWQQQLNLAKKELTQVDQQIAAATIRSAIATVERDNHIKQTDNAAAVQDLMREKYTNQELYDWMLSQTSAIFFQSYKLAYDIAKRAERAFRFERGLTTSDYISFGYWDSLRKGLLSGEQLSLDLKRMEMAYLDKNKRDYEITKHISLVLTEPMALIALKETGLCIVDLPEPFFDTDYPGHYMRRVKSVSLTIPCVTGPFTNINCTLTLLKSSIRQNGKAAGSEGNYARDTGSDDPRFVDNFSAVESITTSHAQNDSGMFELNFRDERYLPFEGAGAISTWRIEMPKDCNAFDFETISDVILNVNYTAREGGQPLRDATRNALSMSPTPDRLRMFSLKHEFPSDWYKFLHPIDTAISQAMPITLTMERFPFQYRGKTITIGEIEVFLKFKEVHDEIYTADGTPLGDYAKGSTLTLSIISPGAGAASVSNALVSDLFILGGLPHATFDYSTQTAGLGAWSISAESSDIQQIPSNLQNAVTVGGHTYHHLKPEVIEDIVVVCRYSANPT